MSIAIRLPDALEHELSETAKKMRRSKSFLVREAIANYLEDINDYHAGIEVLKNPERIYSSEEVRKELGLDD
ncbi:type II toxin-antitoxin system RelB family antitoxin [Legionella bozemanae]|uniref:type II toxin-antitoxin system RelB family antitoxin n=1 Tax=Legionella bozemanae TaxID=447 RepID=UPI00399CA5DC